MVIYWVQSSLGDCRGPTRYTLSLKQAEYGYSKATNRQMMLLNSNGRRPVKDMRWWCVSVGKDKWNLWSARHEANPICPGSFFELWRAVEAQVWVRKGDLLDGEGFTGRCCEFGTGCGWELCKRGWREKYLSEGLNRTRARDHVKCKHESNVIRFSGFKGSTRSKTFFPF